LPLSLFYLGVTLLALANFATSRLQRWRRWMSDLIMVNVILASITYVYMHYLGMTSPYHTHRTVYFFWHALVSISVLVPMAYIGDYGHRPQKLSTVFYTLCVSFLGFFALSFFIQEEAYSRVAFALSAFLSIVSLTGWRFLTAQGGRFMTRIMGGTKRVVVIGDDERAWALAELIQQERLDGYEFVGFVGLEPRRMSPEMRRNLIGDLHTLPSVVSKAEIHGAIIALEEGAFQTAAKVLAERPWPGLEVKLLVGDPVPGQMSLIDLNFGN
ncbi:MAG TPA: hypothetical protein VK465_12730, partial [Fibrobacteria bacterium]|nr:hypothetical protein [Fibrobacteria bacterium]